MRTKLLLLAVVMLCLAPAVLGDLLYEPFDYGTDVGDVPNWVDVERVAAGPSPTGTIYIRDDELYFNVSGADEEMRVYREVNMSNVSRVAFSLGAYIPSPIPANYFKTETWFGLQSGSSMLFRVGINSYALQFFNGTWNNVSTGGNSSLNLSDHYDFELVIDWESYTYNIQVNGRNYRQGVNFSSKASSFDNMSFFSSQGGEPRNMTVDYVQLGNLSLFASTSISGDVGTSSALEGYCNASHSENNSLPVSLVMRWYNGTSNFFEFNQSGVGAGLYGSHNISSVLTEVGETWSFSCYALSDVASYSNWTANVSLGVANYSLDNCSAFTNRTLNMKIFDEITPTSSLNAFVEIEASYWFVPEAKYPFTMISNNSASYDVCISDDNMTLYADFYIQYTADSGFTHRYYLINQSLSNDTLNISMYNFATTTGISDVTITLRDAYTYTYLANVIGKMQRRYVGEGVWRTVQMDESGDYGQLLFNIEEEDTDYRFIFMDRDNHVLATTNAMKFICTGGHCSVTYTLDEFSGFGSSNNLSANLSYNNDTGIIGIDWNDATGRTASFTTTVRRERGSSSLLICNNVSSGASGSQSCDVSGFTGTIIVRSYGTIDGRNQFVLYEVIERRAGQLFTQINEQEGGFWTVGIVTTCFMFGLFSPVGAVIAVVLGLVFAKLLGLLSVLSVTLIIIVAAMGVTIGLKVRK